MKMKNKMKDSKVEFEEWWEVVKEYFTKELEKKLVQHRIDEKIMKYKLEAYQKNFPNFICGNPTSTKVSCQDEENEARPGGTTQEEEVQIEEPQDLISGTIQKEEQEKPQDLRGGGREGGKPLIIQKQEKVEVISSIEAMEI